MDAELLRGLVAELRADAKNFTGPRRRHFEYVIDRVESCLSVAQGQGFVMVPRVPTEAMRAVLTNMLTNCHSVSESYAELLAAAPAQPDGVSK